MAIVVTLVGILLVAAGVVIAVAPKRFIDWISSLEPGVRFWAAILVRVALGVWFLLAAPSCRLPVVVQVVGILSLIAAAAILLIGRTSLDAFMDWWLGLPQSLLRSWSVLAVGFGALLIYAGA